MLIRKTEYEIAPKGRRDGVPAPKIRLSSPQDSVSPINRLNNKEPLNNNLNELSFKGSFLYKEANKGNKYLEKELLEFCDKYLGHMGDKLYRHVANSDKKLAKQMFRLDKESGEITFYKKTVPHLVFDGLILKNLRVEIENGMLRLLKRVKPIEAWASKRYEKLKPQRANSKIEAQISALRGLAETRAKLIKEGKTEEEIRSYMFQRKMKMFDPKTGNYDTKHERSLNRIVSGIPPAIFLANDAYNLSRMMDDDGEKADKEKKIRFRQELSRIFLNAYITLVTFGALQKVMNNSNLGIMLTTGLTALFTESVSRLSNGKHIKRISPEEARRENEKNNAPEKDIKPEDSKKSSNNTFKANLPGGSDNKAQQKPLLSIDTLAKASLGVIVAGFGIKGLRKIKSVDDALYMLGKPFKNLYNKLTTTPEYKYDAEKFEKIVNVLKENGFSANGNANDGKQLSTGVSDLVEDYTRVSKYSKNADGTISLGARDRKIKPFVNFVIAPFKFVWNAVTLPYRLVDKAIKAFSKTPQLVKMPIDDKGTIKVIADNMKRDLNLDEGFVRNIEQFVENLKKKSPKALTETEKVFLNRAGDVAALAKSLDNIGKRALKKNFNPQQFHDYVSDNLLKAFNVDTMSNVSNAELSNLAKTAATAATLWFLMTDNYNMVMLKSNGNDVEGAQTKFKERFVQEISRLFYQTLLIDLFNSTFRSQYNKSLLGMTWITLTNTTIGEWLTRKSVGVPVGAHTRQELLEAEQRQDNATGFLKGYYNFMQRLTGKRSIKSYEIKGSEPFSAAPVINNVNQIPFQRNSILETMIRS